MTSCDRWRDDSAARQAGREAYRASKDLKKGAKRAAHDLRTAGKQFREGWKEAHEADRADHHR